MFQENYRKFIEETFDTYKQSKQDKNIALFGLSTNNSNKYVKFLVYEMVLLQKMGNGLNRAYSSALAQWRKLIGTVAVTLA